MCVFFVRLGPDPSRSTYSRLGCYFCGNGNCHCKHKKSSKTNHENWEATLSQSITNCHKLKYQLTNSGARNCGIMVNRQKGNQKAWPFESNTAKFSQSRHGSSQWNMFLRSVSKLSDICHFIICQIWRENWHESRWFKAKIFLCLDVNNPWI